AGADNFVRLVVRLLGAETDGRNIRYDGRVVRTGGFPISLDVDEMGALGRDPAVIRRAKQLRGDLGDPDGVIVGVDRLHYAQGIAHRLKAYRGLLADGLVKVQDTVMVQVAVPSRQRVEHY